MLAYGLMERVELKLTEKVKLKLGHLICELVWYIDINVSEKHAMFIFRVEKRSPPHVSYRMHGIVHAQKHACLKHNPV